MRRALAAFALLAATLPAQAGPLSVSLDEAKVITFAKPVSQIYVANPIIADINLIDTRHAFVLGKAFGATNIIALDANGTQISSSQVVVMGREESVLTLYKGVNQTTLTCVNRCEASPTPGDSKDVFENAVGEIDRHQEQNKKAAGLQ